MLIPIARDRFPNTPVYSNAARRLIPSAVALRFAKSSMSFVYSPNRTLFLLMLSSTSDAASTLVFANAPTAAAATPAPAATAPNPDFAADPIPCIALDDFWLESSALLDSRPSDLSASVTAFWKPRVSPVI